MRAEAEGADGGVAEIEEGSEEIGTDLEKIMMDTGGREERGTGVGVGEVWGGGEVGEVALNLEAEVGGTEVMAEVYILNYFYI